MQQLSFNFETAAPFNAERLSGQNRRLYEWLAEGHTIHCFHPARQKLRIGYLNSRISDLRKAGLKIFKRRIKVKDINGEAVSVKEYSLKEFKGQNEG